jgi:hypothetical protein
MKSSTRIFHWPVLGIGIALIVAPFAMSLPSKASAGQTIRNAARPIFQPASVRTSANYYYGTFVKLRTVAVGGAQAAGEVPELIAALATQLHMTPTQVQQFLATGFPATASLLGSFPQLVPVFQNVPPGLDYYKPLINTMQANVSNYAKIDSLPNFRLFTWFFVVPGILLVLLSGLPLLLSLRRRTTVAAEVRAASPSQAIAAGESSRCRGWGRWLRR